MKGAIRLILVSLIFLIELNISFSITDVYCDWQDDDGNPLCEYSGHWADLSSRDHPPYMTRNADYDDIEGDDNLNCGSSYATCKYEEEDAYAVNGIEGYLNSLTDLDIAFEGGAMDWYGGLCGTGSNCNVWDLIVYCGNTEEYNNDPCIGYCNEYQNNDRDCTISSSTPTGNYWLKVYGSIDTLDQSGNSLTEYTAGYESLSLDCTDNGDCTDGKTCQVDGNHKGTTCNCVQTAGTCNGCLNQANGNSCDCWDECSEDYCWGTSISTYVCHNDCAADGNYAYQASECCNSWNSGTKQCYCGNNAGYCDDCLDLSNGNTCECNNECQSGNCVGGTCRSSTENSCANGIDDDSDGYTDCDDSNCEGLTGPNSKICCNDDAYNCGTCKYCSNDQCENRPTTYQCNANYECSNSVGGDNAYNFFDYKSPSQGYCDGSGNCDYIPTSGLSICNLGQGTSQEGSAYNICQDTYSLCRNTCQDNKDNDGDGCFDSVDSQCGGTENCIDGIDNNCDDKIDNDDSLCEAPPVCDGTIEVNTADSLGNSLPGLKVYLNGAYNDVTNNFGQKRISRNNVVCGANQEIMVKCSDDTNICDVKNTQVDLDGDIDYLNFDCTKCSTKNDLYFSQEDIHINNSIIKVTVHSTQITASNIVIKAFRLDNSGIQREDDLDTISISAGSETNATLNLNLQSTDCIVPISVNIIFF